jgi:hypothetical protein
MWTLQKSPDKLHGTASFPMVKFPKLDACSTPTSQKRGFFEPVPPEQA